MSIHSGVHAPSYKRIDSYDSRLIPELKGYWKVWVPSIHALLFLDSLGFLGLGFRVQGFMWFGVSGIWDVQSERRASHPRCQSPAGLWPGP